MTAVRQVDQRFARQDPVAEARRVGEGLLVLEGLSGPKDLVVPLPIHASFLSGNKVEVALTDQLAARPAEHCAEGVVEKQDPVRVVLDEHGIGKGVDERKSVASGKGVAVGVDLG